MKFLRNSICYGASGYIFGARCGSSYPFHIPPFTAMSLLYHYFVALSIYHDMISLLRCPPREGIVKAKESTQVIEVVTLRIRKNGIQHDDIQYALKNI